MQKYVQSVLLLGLLLAGSALEIAATGAAQARESSGHSVTIVGPEELYLATEEMTCPRVRRGGGADVTDIPVTAFRRSDGSVVVISGNRNNWHLEGPSVDEARRTSCDHLIEPVNDPDPSTFTNARWLFAIHAKSYEFVLGFVHNEYHGAYFLGPECEVTVRHLHACWYGSTGLVVSTDGGFSFEAPPHPDNVLAAPPVRFTPGAYRTGANTPKVVGNPRDDQVYVMINYLDLNRDMRAEQCLLRGSGLAFNDWRAWDGEGFNLDMESPYAIDRSAADCTPVVPYTVFSVKYVPAIDQFVSIGQHRRQIVYAFSDDLITWSRPKVLTDARMKQRWQPGMEPPRSYWSLLDSNSSSINFDTLEDDPYLYFVQYHIEDDRLVRQRRDIYRVPIRID